MIDIIDGATKDGALVDDCIDALNARGVLDEDVSNGVKKAIGDAACFRPSADSKTRLADTRQLFGADAKRALEFALMEPLKEAYAEKGASEDPKKIAELRTTRNANTFKTLLVAMPGYAAKGLRSTDSDLNLFCDTYQLGDHPSIFKDALRDGTVSISSILTNAVPLLDKMMQAKIFSTFPEASSVGLRDCLPKGDDSKPLGAALFVRLQTRFEATGIKTVPASLSALANQNIETQEGQSEACLRLNASRKGALMRMRGFGTLDPARLLQLFNVAGIDLAPLDGGDINAKVDSYEKVFCLSTIAAMSGFKLDGPYDGEVVGFDCRKPEGGDNPAFCFRHGEGCRTVPHVPFPACLRPRARFLRPHRRASLGAGS